MVVQPSLCPLVTSRTASLSAIHRGVRRSERVQFGEASYSRRHDEVDRRERRGSGGDRLTTKALGGAASPRQQQKLRKKLDRKAAEDDEEESGRQTRRKRFLDPESSFGKNSMVYQLKHGNLKEEAASLRLQQPVRPRFQSSFGPDRRPFDRDERSSGRDRPSFNKDRKPFDRDGPSFGRDKRSFDRDERSSGKDERSFGRKERSFDRDEQSSGRDEVSFGRNKRPFDREEKSFGRDKRSSGRDRQPFNRERQPFDRDMQSRPRSPTERYPLADGNEDQSAGIESFRQGPRKPMMAMTIKYTTAASQFLYGKSVVKAALEQARRKLYNLYIYGGENRKDSKDNAIISRLANKQGVPVTIVPNGEQRLMDKMSMGRPHNGFVLEASPLPQLPITALGKLEESPIRLGFHVELDHQSKEQEDINGRETFIARASDVAPKPLILLLHEILDPGNLGALLRTASYLGVDAVGITNHGSSSLTPVVLKAAAGAVEEITIFEVNSPVKFIEASKKAGWVTYAAVAPPEREVWQTVNDRFISTDFIEKQRPLSEHPCIMVLGNEGQGLPKQLRTAADWEVSVPRFMKGSCVDSLNVGVAAGLLCHSFVKAESIQSKIPDDAVVRSLFQARREPETVQSQTVETPETEEKTESSQPDEAVGKEEKGENMF